MLPCKIAIVGEAPGENEAIVGKPFIGASGKLLDGLLRIAGIDRSMCFIGNVFEARPPNNDVSFFFAKKGVVKEEWKPEIARLKRELEVARPNIVIALGATALWALTNLEGISKYRGTVVLSSLVTDRTLKILPSFHPAYVMRQWQSRPTVGKDLIKARIESLTPDLVRPAREIWIRPTLADLAEFDRKHMNGAAEIAADIENAYPSKMRQITCIGFAPSKEVALVVPFVDRTRKSWSYWDTAEEEAQALEWCLKWLTSPVTKVMQNGMFDTQWIERMWRTKVQGFTEDTMIMSHALQPELEKGLGYLASVYTNEVSWKNMVSWKKEQKAGA